MKKIMLTAMIAVIVMVSANAQEGLTVGVHAGIPIGDASDISNFNYGIDVSYLFYGGEGFDLGFATGYTNFSGKDQTISILGATTTIEIEDAGFIPLAGTARYSFDEDWFLGADLGYAISTVKDGKGGIYYQPKVGWKSETMDVFGFYKGINNDGATLGSFGVGVGFRF